MNKKWLAVIGIISLVTLFGLTGCESGSVSTGEIGTIKLSSQQEGIWVSGSGEVSATPDIASLRVGVDAEAKSVADAREQAALAMQEVMDALETNDIDAKDIQTDYFSVQQVSSWDRETGEQTVEGYRVVNTVTVTIRNIDTIGTIIDAVADAGGDYTRINSIDFSVEDPSEYYQEARKEAIADAKAKAEELASLSGADLGEVTYISESSYNYPITKSAGMAYDEGISYASTSISPGELDISVTVQVSYAIK